MGRECSSSGRVIPKQTGGTGFNPCMIHTRHGEVEAERSETQGHSQLHRRFKALSQESKVKLLCSIS